jgi:Flp pilus assembly protein TadG
MNSSLDLNLLFITGQSSGGQGDSPDLFAVTPPRRAARGREADGLIIYLSMTGNSPLTPREHSQLLEQMSQKFYKTTGSLTAALRTVAEALNLHLLDRNLRSTGGGRQGVGQLLLVALRADTLYIAESGAVRAYLVTPQETQPLYDLQTSGRGLGLSRSLPVRYLQIKMAADDYLVLCTIATPGWSDSAIQHPSKAGIEALRQQLVLGAELEFNAVIVQAQAGTGKLKMLKRKTDNAATAYPLEQDQQVGSESAPPSAAQTVENARQESSPVIPTTGAPETPQSMLPVADKGLGVGSVSPVLAVHAAAETPVSRGEREKPVPASTQAASSKPAAAGSAPPLTGITAGDPVQAAAPKAKASVPPAQTPETPPVPKPHPWTKTILAIRVTLGSVLAAVWRATRSALGTIGAALFRLLKNILPDADVLRLPPSTMVFFAIAIPLVLAVIGGIVFLQRGEAQQQQIYYQKALEKAAYAATLTNPLEQRLAYQIALGELDKAGQYSVTSQSQELRTQLTASLDTLDSVKRLDYKQAIVSGLETGVNVTRIVATTADLYLLDGTQGKVLHAILTGRGYELDPNFQCGPTEGPINVGPLVDIAELPPGAYEDASVLGIDANGNLLYCVVGSQPYSASLAPPNTGLGAPVGISFDGGDLFVLDPQVNAVWIYRNLEVSQQPRLYFGDSVPPMQDVIDMAVYNDDLFLLHTDGHTTKCVYSGMAQSPTRCEDPFPYSDNRPGRSHGPVIEDGIFTQIFYASFPERSIFYLEPKNQSIFYFSVQLTLQSQYQPKEPLAEGNATAFAISPNRIAFLAIGNNVYYAAMP